MIRFTRRPWTGFLFILTLALVSACASSGNGDQAPTNQDRLTFDELQSVQANSLYDAVQRLRPRWLTEERRSGSRSFGMTTDLVVYHHQTFLGGVDVLREWSPDAVRQLQWLDGPKAAATLSGLGSRHVAGAIVIHTRDHN